MQELGIKTATPILQNCIPQILAGADCIGAAKSRSGKTFTFALPILQKLSEQPVNHFALILTTSLKLAFQISELFKLAGQPLGVRVCMVAGGIDKSMESLRDMASSHIVVAMPGCLVHHLRCAIFSFRSLKFLVVDEADRILSGDFDQVLDVIKRYIPNERQNLFFSTTVKDFMKQSSIFPISDQAFEWSDNFNITRNPKDPYDFHYICPDYRHHMAVINAHREYIEENENANAKKIKYYDLRWDVLDLFNDIIRQQHDTNIVHELLFPCQKYDYASLALNKKHRHMEETEMAEPIDLRNKIVGPFPEEPNIMNDHPAGMPPLDPPKKRHNNCNNNWLYNNHRNTNSNGRIQRCNSNPWANLNSKNGKIILEELKQRNPDIIIEAISTNRQNSNESTYKA